GSGNDQQRPFGGGDGFALCFVEIVQQSVHNNGVEYTRVRAFGNDIAGSFRRKRKNPQPNGRRLL
ncbi:MAG: hypothetical protein KAW61_07505, partial [candidate division Zixibacteria bacterium]|nr:hypothetical protein [candidate division Zixibacteria bacterium]